MPRVELLDAALDDLERIVEHLRAHDSRHARARAAEILDAVGILRDNPHMGRPAGGAMRELVIGAKQQGYVVLYRHAVDIDIVIVLAIRGQREAGYRDG